MTGASIRVDINVGAVATGLDKIDAGLASPGPLMAGIGEDLVESTRKRFDAQTEPDGTKWKDLDDRYRKRKKHHQDKILTLHEYLRGGRQGSGPRWQLDGDDAVLVGNNEPYARIHQLGGVIEQLAQSRRQRFRTVAGRVLFAGKKHKKATERWVSRGAYQIKIKPRPFLGLSVADRQAIKQRVEDWLRSQV